MDSSTTKKVEIYCLFDITASGVSSQHKNTAFPVITKQGQQITDPVALAQARNQQRNFDTLLQLLSLRTQIFEIKNPELTATPPQQFHDKDRVWRMEFEIEPQSQWLVDNDDFWMLKQDSNGTPMIVGLTESPGLAPVLDTASKAPNILYQYV